MFDCLFCNKPLDRDYEVASEGRIKWHSECQVCGYCKEPVTHELASKLIENENNRLEPDIHLSESLYHQPCHERALNERFKNKDLPIVQAQLDVLNQFLLSTRTEISLDLPELYTLLRDLQQAAANVSIALNRKKDKIKIKDAEVYRNTVAIRSENEKLEKRTLEEKKIRLASERADPALRAKRKALQGLMDAFKLTQEQAEAMLAGQSGAGGGIKQ